LTAAVALAAPAGATVTLPHSIATFYHRDFVQLSGYEKGSQVSVELLRNGVVIATAGATSPFTPTDDPSTGVFDGLVTINHPPTAPDPLMCWDNGTPTLQPGDVVRSTTLLPDGTTQVDSSTVAGIDVTQPATLVGGNVVVKGTAVNASGGQVSLAELEQRMVANKQAFAVNGKRTLRAGATGTEGTLAYDGPGLNTWTVTYSGLSSGDQAMAVGAESRIMDLGPNPTLVNPAGFGAEQTIAEVGGPKPATHVPAPGCPAQVTYAVTSVDSAHMFSGSPVINAGNQGSPITVSGASNDASAVSVTLSDGAHTTAPQTATPVNGAFSVTFPASDVATLNDGPVTAAGSYTTPAGSGVTGGNLTIDKDTVAPGAPTISPAPGTYARTQVVTLSSADPTAKIHNTVDGSAPGVSSPTTNPLTITASQTVNAVAVDPAGNPSGMSSFVFTIDPNAVTPGPGVPLIPGAGPVLAPALPASPAPAPVPAPAPLVVPGLPKTNGALTGPGTVTGTAPGNVTGTGTTPASLVKGLTITHATVASLRRGGLKVSMRVPAGSKVVALRIFRMKAGKPTGHALLTTIRRASGKTAYAVTLRGAAIRRLRKGSYVLTVQVGKDRKHLTAGGSSTFIVG
jgi:hypothetical protein